MSGMTTSGEITRRRLEMIVGQHVLGIEAHRRLQVFNRGGHILRLQFCKPDRGQRYGFLWPELQREAQLLQRFPEPLGLHEEAAETVPQLEITGVRQYARSTDVQGFVAATHLPEQPRVLDVHIAELRILLARLTECLQGLFAKPGPLAGNGEPVIHQARIPEIEGRVGRCIQTAAIEVTGTLVVFPSQP
jgi:hypothetical protein